MARSLCDSGSITENRAPIIRKSRAKTTTPCQDETMKVSHYRTAPVVMITELFAGHHDAFVTLAGAPMTAIQDAAAKEPMTLNQLFSRTNRSHPQSDAGGSILPRSRLGLIGAWRRRERGSNRHEHPIEVVAQYFTSLQWHCKSLLALAGHGATCYALGCS